MTVPRGSKPRARRAASAASAVWARMVHRDTAAGYDLARALSSVLAPQYRFSEPGRAWMADEAFLGQYRALTGGALLEMADKKVTLRSLARWTRGVPGQVAECGCYRGVSSWFLAEETEGTDKRLHLFDSFEGVSAPTSADGGHWQEHDLRADEDECRRLLAPFGERIALHRGWIPDRFADVEDETFSLVHVDVDLYEPHRDSIDFFWPRLATGGVMVFDDYGSTFCPGARRAVDEAFDPEEIVELPTAQAFVVKRG